MDLDYKKKNPLLLRHVRMLRICLSIIGAWPSEAFGGSPRRIYFSICMLVATVLTGLGEIYYVTNKIHLLSFFDLGDICMTMLLTVLTLARSVLPSMKNYGLITSEFMMKFHLVHFKHRSDYYEKICNQINYFSHYFALAMMTSMMMGTWFFNLAPFYNNYLNGGFSENRTETYRVEFSIYWLCPGINPEEHPIKTSILNLFLSHITGVLVCGIDLLMALIAFQIIGHIKALEHDLQHLPSRPVGMKTNTPKINQFAHMHLVTYYDSRVNQMIYKEIVNCVEHHKYIVRFAHSVSQFFGPVLAFNYFYHLVGCGLLLLEISTGEPDALARYGPVTVITFVQLIQISVTFEIIGSESEKLKDAVYTIPWECMNISNQKLVWMFLVKIQIPIRVTALGMADVGVKTMVSILKTTFSYFALLQSMRE